VFFDRPKQDEAYLGMMEAIAKKQRELLDCRFCWEEKTSRLPVKQGFFRRKKPDAAYERLKTELEDLKRQTVEYRKKKGYGSGTFWWNLPWEQIEDYLIYDLSRLEGGNGWRFEQNYEVQPVEDRMVLFLHEEGHCSNFSHTTTFETGIISAYSQSEIDDKMRDYDHMMNRYDLTTLALSDHRPVTSYRSGLDYDSTADYLLSAEHYMVRDHYREQYAKSLYTEMETTTLYVSSNSTHYEAVYAIAVFGADGAGKLNHLEVENYQLCANDGSVPESIEEFYLSKDAAVSCAAFLADYAPVTGVPIALFGRDLKESAASFNEALRQAEIYTCLAGKIRI
jgi:hypothetical protein